MSTHPREPNAPDDDGAAGAGTRLVLDLLETAGPDDDAGLAGFLSRAATAAARLAGSGYAAVGVAEPGPARRLGLVVHTGADPDDVEVVDGSQVRPGLTALLRPQPLHSADRAPRLDASDLPGAPAADPLLVVPIPADGAPGGFLCLAGRVPAERLGGYPDRTPDPGPGFSAEQEATARALAATIGTRIDQERTCDQHVRRAEWLAASLQITSDLVASDSPEWALNEVSDLAREVSGADAAWIRAGRSPDELVLAAVSRGRADVPVPDDVEDALTRRVVEEGRCERVRATGDQLSVVVPLRSPSGLYGSLTLTWAAERRADFEAVPTDLPASFAEQAVLAMEVARSREARGRVRVLEERNRIARDLHDVVLQDLFATALELRQVARRTNDPEARRGIERAAGELQTTSRNIRRSIFGLEVCEAGGDLRAEVARLVQRATAMLKIDVTLTVGGELEDVQPELGRDLVAVLGEALSNVTRHADPDTVSVRIETSPGLRVTVSDDGVGIPADARLSGLDNMRRRAEQRGGRLTLTQRACGGTCLEWSATAAAAAAAAEPAGADATAVPGGAVRATLRDVSEDLVEPAPGHGGDAAAAGEAMELGS